MPTRLLDKASSASRTLAVQRLGAEPFPPTALLAHRTSRGGVTLPIPEDVRTAGAGGGVGDEDPQVTGTAAGAQEPQGSLETAPDCGWDEEWERILQQEEKRPMGRQELKRRLACCDLY